MVLRAAAVAAEGSFVMIAVTMGISVEQCFAATALMVVSLAFTALLHPYKVGWITLVDCAGHLVIILCILIGITWCGPDSDPSEAATNGSNVAIVFMVVSFAAVLVVLLIYQSCGCAREEGGEGEGSNAADETNVHDLASDVGTSSDLPNALPPNDSGEAKTYELGIEMTTITELSGMPSAPETPAQMEHDDADDIEELWHSLEQKKTRPHTSSFAGLR